MSVKMMGLVWDTLLPPNERLVLLAYADHADHDGGNIYPAVLTIADKTGYSERNVQYLTRKLEDKGLLLPDGEGPQGTNRWRMGVQTLHQGVQPTAPGGVQPTAPEPPSEPSVKIEEPPKPHAAMFEALADVTEMDYEVKTNAGRIARASAQILKANYTADQVRTIYGQGGAWYVHDFRGRKGQPPTVEQVFATIRTLLAHARLNAVPDDEDIKRIREESAKLHQGKRIQIRSKESQ